MMDRLEYGNGLFLGAKWEDRYLRDVLSLSVEDLLGYFKYIPPEDFKLYGIDQKDIPFGMFPAFKHPTLLSNPLGGNAYGIGLFEHHLLSDDELRLLESLDMNDPENLITHQATINEIYRKMGLLIRLSRKGVFYYLIPFSFVAHSILDIRCRVNITVSLLTEIQEEKGLKIGILTSPDDILIHEFIARFPQHRFFILSSVHEISTRVEPFDAIICPHSVEDYVKIALSDPKVRTVISKKKLLHYCGYVLSLVRRILKPKGTFVIISPSNIVRTSSKQVVTFLSETSLKLFKAFVLMYRLTLPELDRLKIGEEVILLTGDMQAFFLFAPSVKAEVQKTLNRPLDFIDEKELPLLISRYKSSFSNIIQHRPRSKSLLNKFFKVEVCNEIFPQEYRNLWEGHIKLQEFPPLFVCIKSYPREPKVSEDDVKKFLQKSPFAGCPVSLAADYKNTLVYISHVLGYLEEELLRNWDGLRFSTKALTSQCPVVKQLLSCRKRLNEAQAILGPPEITNEPVKFLNHVSDLSLLGFSKSQLQEMGLIVVGHSSLGRVVMGKYPSSTLEPLSQLMNSDPESVQYLVLMTIAELATSLGRQLGEAELKRIDEIVRLFGADRKFPEGFYSSEETLLQQAYKRIFIMTRTGESALSCKFPVSEELVIKNLGVNEDFLITFLRARFHGTGHILPLLGFFPSLILLWASVAFWRYVSINIKDRSRVFEGPDLIINLNPVLQGVPQEHRAERTEKLKRSLLSTVDVIATKSLPEIISETYKGENRWFWEEAKLQFWLNEELGAVDIDYLDPEESAKILENHAKSLENKTVRAIPSIFIQEAEHHLHKILQHGQRDINVSLGNIFVNKPPLNLALIHLWKSFFEKLLSPEEAYEALVTIGRKSPRLLSMVIPNYREEDIDSLARAFYRLRSVTEKGQLPLSDLSYTAGKKEFGPYAQENLKVTDEQLGQLEEMLYSVHSDFLLYQAMMLALIAQHGLSNELHQRTTILLENMVKADLITEANVGTIQKHIFNLLESSRTIRLVGQGRSPLISLDKIIPITTKKTFLDASFLLATIYDDISEGAVTNNILTYLLELRQKLLKVIADGKSWQSYMIELMARIEDSVILDSHRASLPIEEDSVLYARFVHRIEEEDYSPFCKGRYIMALNRLLRFHGLLPIQFEDAISFVEGTPLNVLYRQKGIPTIGFNTFKSMIEKTVSIFENLFSLSPEERLRILSDFDELSPFTVDHSPRS